MAESSQFSRLIHGWTQIDDGKGATREFDDFVSSNDFLVVDCNGIEFIDARSMVWNVAFGHNQPSISAAVAAQMNRLTSVPTLDGQATATARCLAERLTGLTGMSRVYLSLSGSAANEVAITIARDYQTAIGIPERRVIVSLKLGYHGQSIGTLPLAGFSGLQMPGAPESLDYALVPNCYCYRCPVGQAREICNIECADSAIARIEALRPDRVAALIIEPIQGSVGHPPPVEWFKRLADYLKKHGILLIVDEVANGFARLGNNFAFEAFRIQPDVLTLSKAITNGALPMAATLTTAEVTNVLIEAGWTPSFGSTQDGNPVCAAAALATLDILEAEDWASRAQYLGKRLDKMLRREIGNHPNVGEIRGMGLFRAVELVQNRATRSAFKKTEALAKELKDRRLLVRCDGGIIIIAPPLSTPHEVIDEIAFRVGAALRSTSGS